MKHYEILLTLVILAVASGGDDICDKSRQQACMSPLVTVLRGSRDVKVLCPTLKSFLCCVDKIIDDCPNKKTTITANYEAAMKSMSTSALPNKICGLSLVDALTVAQSKCDVNGTWVSENLNASEPCGSAEIRHGLKNCSQEFVRSTSAVKNSRNNGAFCGIFHKYLCCSDRVLTKCANVRSLVEEAVIKSLPPKMCHINRTDIFVAAKKNCDKNGNWIQNTTLGTVVTAAVTTMGNQNLVSTVPIQITTEDTTQRPRPSTESSENNQHMTSAVQKESTMEVTSPEPMTTAEITSTGNDLTTKLSEVTGNNQHLTTAVPKESTMEFTSPDPMATAEITSPGNDLATKLPEEVTTELPITATEEGSTGQCTKAQLINQVDKCYSISKRGKDCRSFYKYICCLAKLGDKCPSSRSSIETLGKGKWSQQTTVLSKICLGQAKSFMGIARQSCDKNGNWIGKRQGKGSGHQISYSVNSTCLVSFILMVLVRVL